MHIYNKNGHFFAVFFDNSFNSRNSGVSYNCIFLLFLLFIKKCFKQKLNGFEIKL